MGRQDHELLVRILLEGQCGPAPEERGEQVENRRQRVDRGLIPQHAGDGEFHQLDR